MAEWFVVGLVVFVIGGFIAAYARRRAREDIVIHASPQHLWSIITDYSRFPEWQPETEQVTPEANGQSTEGAGAPESAGWTETHKDGLRYRYHIRRAEPPHRITWRYDALVSGDETLHPAAGQGRGPGGTWTLTLQPLEGSAAGAACRVHSRVVDRRSGSLWRRTINALRGPRSHQGMYLECLKARAEGEPHGASPAAARA